MKRTFLLILGVCLAMLSTPDQCLAQAKGKQSAKPAKAGQSKKAGDETAAGQDAKARQVWKIFQDLKPQVEDFQSRAGNLAKQVSNAEPSRRKVWNALLQSAVSSTVSSLDSAKMKLDALKLKPGTNPFAETLADYILQQKALVTTTGTLYNAYTNDNSEEVATAQKMMPVAVESAEKAVNRVAEEMGPYQSRNKL